MTLGFDVDALVARARGGGALRMGLSRVSEAAWLCPAVDEAARAAAFDEDNDAVIVLPEAEAAAREAAMLVAGEATLGAAARRVWEDLCLVLPGTGTGTGAPRLVAGALGFPTDWRLGDKIGLGIAAVHAPIHGYAEQLAAGVDHFLATLAPGVIFGRANWFVVPTDALRYLPADAPEERFAHVTAANAGETLFVRCERQTLRRLPESGAVLFTIGIHVAPLGTLADATVARVAASVAALGEGEHARRAAPHYAAALAAHAAARTLPRAA